MSNDVFGDTTPTTVELSKGELSALVCFIDEALETDEGINIRLARALNERFGKKVALDFYNDVHAALVRIVSATTRFIPADRETTLGLGSTAARIEQNRRHLNDAA